MIKNKLFFFADTSVGNVNQRTADFFENHAWNPISVSMVEHDGWYYLTVVAKPIGEPLEDDGPAEDDEPDPKAKSGIEMFNKLNYFRREGRENGIAGFKVCLSTQSDTYGYNFNGHGQVEAVAGLNSVVIPKAELEACLQVMKDLEDGNA